MADLNLELPLHFRPRSYQWEFLTAMRGGCKRAALVWHRRAGKDAAVVNWTIEAMVQRPGSYYYFFPTLKLGRRILWNGIQADGKPFLSHFPQQLIIGDPNETEMSIRMRCPGGGHSIFQILGAKEVDEAAIGTNPVGCVFSEYSLQSPRAWDMVRPILAENLGWAVFPFTPRGKNWGHKLWTGALSSPQWFTSMRTVEQTVRDGEDEGNRAGQPVVSLEAIADERRLGMAEELIQQEFYCSFEGAIMGAYYSQALEQMAKEGRICSVPWNRDLPVHTAWDLGVDDETVIGFFQTVEDYRRGREWEHLIDVHVGRNMGLDEYWRYLRNEKPYAYGNHYGPWDLAVREMTTGTSRVESAQQMGLYFEIVKKLGVADGINAVRRMLPNLLVDEEHCGKWLDMMRAYHREFDEERQTYLDKPVHDESSHWADMTRVRAVAYVMPDNSPMRNRTPLPETGEIDYDVFETRNERDELRDWARNAENWSPFDRGR